MANHMSAAPRLWVFVIVFGIAVTIQFAVIGLSAAMLCETRLPEAPRIAISTLVERLTSDVVSESMWVMSWNRNLYGVGRIVCFGILLLLAGWLGPRFRWLRWGLVAWLTYVSPAVLTMALDFLASLGDLLVLRPSMDVEYLLEGIYSDVATTLLWVLAVWWSWTARGGLKSRGCKRPQGAV